MDPPVGRDHSGPDVQAGNAMAGKVMNQVSNRIQPDAVLRDDDPPAAGALELGRHPEPADVSPPRRQSRSLDDRLGTRLMWHRWDGRRRPTGGRQQPFGKLVNIEQVVTPQVAGDPREVAGERIMVTALHDGA